MFHSWTIVGYLARDPEMRYTANGQPVTTLNVPVNETWTKDGIKQEKVTWYRCTAWGKAAETMNQYAAKGTQILIIGRPNPDESGNPRIWGDDDPKASYDVTITYFKFLGGGTRQSSNTSQDTEEEIPF